MAKTILVALQCLRNVSDPILVPDITQLTQFFKSSFEYYLYQEDEKIQSFIQCLETLLSIGNILANQTGGETEAFQICHRQFLQYIQDDFRKHPTILDALSIRWAHFVRWAIKSFQSEHWIERSPESFEWFVQYLEKVLVHEGLTQTEQENEINSLIQALRSNIST